MARQVNVDEVDEDDLRYLRDRPWLVTQAKTEGFDLQERIDALDDNPEPVEIPSIGDLSVREDPTPTAKDPATAPSGSNDGSGTEDDYDEWKVSELQDEIEKRNDIAESQDLDVEQMSKTGNKAELIARLRQNDSDSQ